MDAWNETSLPHRPLPLTVTTGEHQIVAVVATSDLLEPENGRRSVLPRFACAPSGPDVAG